MNTANCDLNPKLIASSAETMPMSSVRSFQMRFSVSTSSTSLMTCTQPWHHLSMSSSSPIGKSYRHKITAVVPLCTVPMLLLQLQCQFTSNVTAKESYSRRQSLLQISKAIKRSTTDFSISPKCLNSQVRWNFIKLFKHATAACTQLQQTLTPQPMAGKLLLIFAMPGD